MSGAEWREKSPVQRQAERRELLLDAALDLIGEGGLAAAGARAVCRRAGLTSRYFYESFDDVAALHRAVAEQAIVDVLARTRDGLALGAEAGGDMARALMAAALDAFTADDRRARLLLTEMGASPLLASRRRHMLRSFAIVAREQLAELAPEPEDRLILVAADLFAAGFFDLVLSWHEGNLPHARDELIDDAADLLVECTAAVVQLVGQRRRRPAP